MGCFSQVGEVGCEFDVSGQSAGAGEEENCG